MKTQPISRRDFLRLAGLGAFALIGGRFETAWAAPAPSSAVRRRLPAMDGAFMPDA